ncbi:MAG: RNA polymerase sigma factor [Actinobacteria bacterium]|nr:RNA polymerase sigma factor [Actinomycetota bacterium]
MSIGNRDLVARASRGDVDAFSKLVREHSSMVHRVALRVLGAEDAQDASQEVWIRVWANIKNFRGESAFSTWLYRITMNTCLGALRKRRTREARELGEETTYLTEIPGDDADPEEASLGSERRNEIWAALRHVRAEHGAALVLRHMEGLSYAEIAEVLGVPVGTAKGWTSRGRAAMLVALAKKNHGGAGTRRKPPADAGEPGGTLGGAPEDRSVRRGQARIVSATHHN